jgi:putative spermidine/putrescine transport system substrate-binding protein
MTALPDAPFYRPRRRASLTAIAMALAAFAGVAWSQPGAKAAREIVVQDPGGTYGDHLRRLVYDPFTQETGIKVLTVQEARGGPRVKAQVEAGRTEWDLAFVFDQEVRLLDASLAEIDYARLSPEAQKTVASLPRGAVRPKGVALQVIGVALVYGKEAFPAGRAPRNWADFWNVKDFPGKRCLPGWSRFVFEAALLADGVPADRLYPVDFDRALRKIAQIKPHVVKWWQTNSQAPQLLLDGEAAACMSYTGFVARLKKEDPDAPVELVRDQAFTYYDFFSIPKNAPHYDAALKLLSYRLDARRAARLAEASSVALPSPRVYEAADPQLRDYWTNSPEARKKAIPWNADFWGARAPDGTTNEEYAQQKLNQLLAQ